MRNEIIKTLEKFGCTDGNQTGWNRTVSTTLNLHNKNQELDWMPSDTQELFLYNIKDNKKYLQSYIDTPIKYKLNEYGFRTNDSFDSNQPGNVFLGCSHTFGIGHYLENTWSYKMNNMVGGKFYNLSQPGCGIESDYRMLYAYMDKIKIKNVFHFLGFYNRYEVYRDDMFKSISFTDENYINLYRGMFDSHSSNEKLLINQITHVDAIQNICNNLGVNYYVISDLDFFNSDYMCNLNSLSENKARDLIHYTVEIQNEIYEKFKKLYIHNNII